MIDNVPEKTGKSLDEWKKILKTNIFGQYYRDDIKSLKEKETTKGKTRAKERVLFHS